MRIDQRRQQIVRGSERMKISMKMKVNLPTRFNLRKPPASRPALHPKHRPERRLPRSDHRALSDKRQPLRQPNRGNSFSLARNSRRRPGNQNQLPPPPVSRISQQLQTHLRAILPKLFEISFWNFQFSSDSLNRKKCLMHVLGVRQAFPGLTSKVA